MGVVGNPELVRHGQQQSVRRRNRLVLLKLLDQNIWLRCITTAENRPCVFFDEADLVPFLASSPEVRPITIVNQGKDTSADGDSRSAGVARFLSGFTKSADLRGLLDMEGLARLVELER